MKIVDSLLQKDSYEKYEAICKSIAEFYFEASEIYYLEYDETFR